MAGLEPLSDACWELWYLEQHEFDSHLQWIPRELLEDLLDLTGLVLFRRVRAEIACEVAACCGRMAWLADARARNPPCSWSVWTCATAALHGHLPALEWLRAQNPPCPWDTVVCDYAALRGHLAVLQWLRAQEPPCPWDKWTVQLAETNHHTKTAAWARAHGCPEPD